MKYRSKLRPDKAERVFLPPPVFDERIISPQYMGSGLLGFTYGNKDIHIRRDAPDYGHSIAEVRAHERMHNNPRFNHEGNCDEHEMATRRRVSQGIYPFPIYSFERRLDYEEAA